MYSLASSLADLAERLGGISSTSASSCDSTAREWERHAAPLVFRFGATRLAEAPRRTGYMYQVTIFDESYSETDLILVFLT